jgi:hypothetical protein
MVKGRTAARAQAIGHAVALEVVLLADLAALHHLDDPLAADVGQAVPGAALDGCYSCLARGGRAAYVHVEEAPVLEGAVNVQAVVLADVSHCSSNAGWKLTIRPYWTHGTP